MTAEATTRRDARQANRSGSRPPGRRPRVSIVGVLGEVLITAGVFVGLFLVWQLWFNNVLVGNDLRSQAQALQKGWSTAAAPATTAPPTSTTDPQKSAGSSSIPVAGAPAHAQSFANLIVPRFGTGYLISIGEGVETKDVLDTGRIGHYPTSSMPGAVGNFAIAGHRTTHGAPFNQIATLRPGDHIFVQTADGWYQYDFRNLEYVRPTGVGVVAPVPQDANASPTDRILTMTSCNPMYSAAERIIGYSVFDKFWPASGGVPSEIAYSQGGA